MPKAIVHLYQEPRPKRRKSVPLDDGLVAVRLKKGGARRVDPERAEAMRAGGLLAEEAQPAAVAVFEPLPLHEERAGVDAPAEVTGG